MNITDSFGNAVQFGTRRAIDIRFEDCIIDGNATLASVNVLDQSESLGGDGEAGLL